MPEIASPNPTHIATAPNRSGHEDSHWFRQTGFGSRLLDHRWEGIIVATWDLQKLKTLTAAQRHNLWVNARSKSGPEAAQLVELIATSGLDYLNQKSVRLDDPIGKKMERIIFSAEGKRAAEEATANGLPALAGVDPLLATGLGRDYGAHNEATSQAGYLVTNMMRQLGYRDGDQSPLPPGCVARSGRIFLKPIPKSEDRMPEGRK